MSLCKRLKTTAILVAFVAIGLVLVAPVFSEGKQEKEAKKPTVRAVGNFASQIQASEVEIPFYEELEDKADNLNIQFRTMDELGLDGFQAFRQLNDGVYDVMAVQLGYVSGDDLFLQGLDLPGVASNTDEARDVVEALRPHIDKRIQEKFNGKVLGIWHYGDQVFWLKDDVEKLEDLSGRKIRVFSNPQSSFVEYFGAEGISLAYSEVYQGLQRGVIDGAISGALSGNTSSWFEVANYVLPLPMTYSMQFHIANLDFWESLDEETQDFLEKEYKRMEDQMWELGDKVTEAGLKANAGEGEMFDMATNADMEIIEVTDEMEQTAKKVVEEVVLPNWAKNLSDEEIKLWNETAGEAAGVQIQK